MATVLDGLVSSSLRKLTQLLEEEVVITLYVGRDIKKLKQNLECYRAVRQDAEDQAMRDASINLWWKRISDVMFNVDDVIDLFMLLDDHRVATRIRSINIELDDIRSTSEMFTPGILRSPQPQIKRANTSQRAPIVEPGLVGAAIRRDVDSIVDEIVTRCHNNEPSVLGLEGMGGIGKTTLAQKIYNDQRILGRFQIHIWLCISETYNKTELLKQVIRMAGENYDKEESNAELLPILRDTIKGKSVFLVLDNMSQPDVWINLLQAPFYGALIACILVTTRSKEVLQRMHATYTHYVKRMGEDDGLMLLMKDSFPPSGSIFQELGRAIVKKCDGLPLAIKVVAGVLSTRRTTAEWKSIRDSKWSVQGLPKELGDCALLPPNFVIRRDAVAYWWATEGFVREEHVNSIYETSEGYYLELIRRNLLQPKPEFIDKDHSLFMNVKNDHSLFMNVENNGALPNLRRLGISNAVEELPALHEHKCLRTLLVFDNKNFKSVHTDILGMLQHIRVLILCGTGIQYIPESVGNLVLLKLLDLSFTEIKKLPESTGNLISLEYLRLCGCHELHSLPTTLMRLHKISYLELEHSALHHVPKGIANFQHLYNLRGVFESGAGFRFDELRRLPNIQRLWVEKLEKAEPQGELVLKNSPLRELGLCCTFGMNTHDRTRYEANEIERIRKVYDMLIPSLSLVYIFLVGFPELPPAGQIPQLQVLKIEGADAVKTIGAGLLGRGVGSPPVFFPDLVLLLIIRMCNLESWSLNTGNPCDNMEGNAQHLSLMPKLDRLLLIDCPKLEALPRSFFKNLKRIHIEGAHKLQEVVDLPEVVWLKVKNNVCMKKISNLFNLQDLFAQDCPALDQAENLLSLKRVYMVDCHHEQQFKRCLVPGEEQGVLVYVAADGHNIFPDESLYN
ncbi:hypothetical protein BRADI_2g03200v3 [Brachypodium distachyon]|uniref:NB-ARC domain-containing protein n=1 Tax=Brachypodium distachyon TaxID=15368 RepID=A0A0Q3FWX4_BRADI|nr:hypothetical protein BRADI_2g03200v3 [Brachypodium distachyon]